MGGLSGLPPELLGAHAVRRPGRIPARPASRATVTSSPYDPLLRGMIIAHKERQALGLTRLLADRLALSVHVLLAAGRPSGPDPAVVLVPVPSAGRAVRRRGFDATAGDGPAGRPAGCGPDIRSSVRRPWPSSAGVRDQAGLDARARQANLAGGFRLRAGCPAGRVVLVDDLVTTGSSLTEAARVLRPAACAVLGAATVAATERRAGASAGTVRSR